MQLKPNPKSAATPDHPDPETGEVVTPCWGMPEPPHKWDSLNVAFSGEGLPPPGDYPGSIAEVKIVDKGDTLWVIVQFTLDGLEAEPAAKFGVLGAIPGSEYAHRLAEGVRLLYRIAEATGTPITAIQDPFEVPKLFTGKKVSLAIAHRKRDGVPEMEVREIRPR